MERYCLGVEYRDGTDRARRDVGKLSSDQAAGSEGEESERELHFELN